MVNYLIGALVGGVLGYFVLYRLIGYSIRSCPIKSNPYMTTVAGIIFGVLIAGMAAVPINIFVAEESAQPPAIEYKKITAENAKSRISSGDKVIILDVRTEAEYNSGHIQNAVLIPNETIAGRMPELLPELDAEILVYCRSGNRSAQAAKKLIAIGYTNVYDFGGIINWPYDIVKGN